MRIIAGKYRGRRLDAPKGQGTRPTTDRVRESLMSALHSARGGFAGAVVLDAFAGSGALALEALSRGADRAVLCERDREAAGVIERNLRTLGLSPDRARLMRADVVKRPPRLGTPPSIWCFSIRPTPWGRLRSSISSRASTRPAPWPPT